MSQERDPRRNRGRWRVTAMLSTVGLTLALSIGIGIMIGVVLDQWLKTKGILVILGALLGVISGFKELIRVVVQVSREQDAESEERSGSENDESR